VLVTEEQKSLELAECLATAGLRAGLAWSQRFANQDAWREVSRMHGVFVSFLPPGVGPETPSHLIDGLRRPMREWVPLDWDLVPAEAGTFPVLDDQGGLTGEAVEYGSEYGEALFEHHGNGSSQFPRWAWQNFEKIERAVYEVLCSAGQAEYAATRELLIEVPAGPEDRLVLERAQRQALHTSAYIELPPDQKFEYAGAEWYVPCPTCRWPMYVRGTEVRCRYPQHTGLFRLREAAAHAGTPRFDGPRAVAALDATGVRCVHPAVWRYITVPGRIEVDLMAWFRDEIGADLVEQWPEKDAWDITAWFGSKAFKIDLKDTAAPSKIAARPPRVSYVVVPNYRNWQIKQLRRSLPGHRTMTIRSFHMHVKKELGLQ
jgi:hypothetical protein